jgi:hypothetical protein
LHGGLSPGAPRGAGNGNFRNGDWTAEAIEERKWLRSLVRSFAKTGTAAQALILRPGKTPSGAEVAGYLRRLLRRIRRYWPKTRITIRGDRHYGRPEVMDFCEKSDVDFVFGLAGNAALERAVSIERGPLYRRPRAATKSMENCCGQR